MSKWIKCSDRLPENSDDVLVSDGKNVEVKWLYNDDRYCLLEYDTEIKSNEATHWMPLPEPPKD